MKRIAFLLCLVLLTSCKGEPSLQRYFVDHQQDRNFISFDVSPGILKIDPAKLSASQKNALESFNKMNVLAFRVNDSNKAQFAQERDKVSRIMKDPKYQQLMKFSSGKEGASLSFVGDEEHIDEIVVYANAKETGFAVVRILGDDMNPTQIVEMLTSLREAQFNMEQLKPLQEMLEQQKR